MSDPKLSEFLADHARSSDDMAEWYEQQAWRMVQRAEALEVVAAAARSHLDALSTMNWPRQGGKTHLFPSADALNRALASLGGSPAEDPAP